MKKYWNDNILSFIISWHSKKVNEYFPIFPRFLYKMQTYICEFCRKSPGLQKRKTGTESKRCNSIVSSDFPFQSGIHRSTFCGALAFQFYRLHFGEPVQK